MCLPSGHPPESASATGGRYENKLQDLNDYLFEEIERLQDDEADLEAEVKRAEAVTKVSNVIISNATLALTAQKLAAEYGLETHIKNPLLETEGSE